MHRQHSEHIRNTKLKLDKLGKQQQVHTIILVNAQEIETCTY